MLNSVCVELIQTRKTSPHMSLKLSHVMSFNIQQYRKALVFISAFFVSGFDGCSFGRQWIYGNAKPDGFFVLGNWMIYNEEK